MGIIPSSIFFLLTEDERNEIIDAFYNIVEAILGEDAVSSSTRSE